MAIERRAAPVPTSSTLRTRAAARITRAGVGTITPLVGTGPVGVAVARRMIAGLMGAFGSMPSGTVVEAVKQGGVRGEWVYGPGVERASTDRAIYFLHGSAYMMCSAKTHRSYAARMSAVTGLPAFVLDYRLAPEHPFPAAHDDVDAGWEWLVTQGYSPDRLVVAGDSAGGHLAAAFTLNRAVAGGAQPAAVFLASPVIDASFRLAAQQERIRRDPMISADKARRLVELYTAAADPQDARLTLDYSAAAEVPPILVHAGGAEMLSADARHFAERLASAGADPVLEIWPDQMHVFQALPRLGPDADAALLRVRDFFTAGLEAAADTTVTTAPGVAS